MLEYRFVPPCLALVSLMKDSFVALFFITFFSSLQFQCGIPISWPALYNEKSVISPVMILLYLMSHFSLDALKISFLAFASLTMLYLCVDIFFFYTQSLLSFLDEFHHW